MSFRSSVRGRAAALRPHGGAYRDNLEVALLHGDANGRRATPEPCHGRALVPGAARAAGAGGTAMAGKGAAKRGEVAL